MSQRDDLRALSDAASRVIWMVDNHRSGDGHVSDEFKADIDDLRNAVEDAASPSPATDCDIEPAFSQHEYAVDYCETHDRPADQCTRPSPATDAGLDVRAAALLLCAYTGHAGPCEAHLAFASEHYRLATPDKGQPERRCFSCQTPGHYAGDRSHPCIPPETDR